MDATPDAIKRAIAIHVDYRKRNRRLPADVAAEDKAWKAECYAHLVRNHVITPPRKRFGGDPNLAYFK